MQGDTEKSFQCFCSASSHHLSNILNNPVSIYAQSHLYTQTSINKVPNYLAFELPCGYHLVSINLLEPHSVAKGYQILVTLHRHGLYCHVNQDRHSRQCSKKVCSFKLERLIHLMLIGFYLQGLIFTYS